MKSSNSLELNPKSKKECGLQRVLHQVLQVSLEDLPLQELLSKALDAIFNVSFMPIKNQGAIFLVDEKSNSLTLAANQHLPDHLIKRCASVPFGQCICGKAARDKKVLYSGEYNSLHTIQDTFSQSHKHYSVPIIYKGTVTGILNVYLKSTHEKNEFEVDFLSAVANVLAGIIERKKVEGKLKGYVLALEQAKDNAETASNAKSDFLSRMSHELRTPLNSILGFGQLLNEDDSLPLVMQKQYVDYILKSGELLLCLIDEMLDLAKIEFGSINMTIKEISLDGIIKECLSMTDLSSKKHKVTVETDIEVGRYVLKVDYVCIK
ncbi:MAG: GAF domain-containing protein [Bacteriovoracaceae bacterium]|nr:GAF domain-containing protein [Bacteriovoracaceae bacterium]